MLWRGARSAVLALLALAAPARADEDLAAVVDRMIAAYGGRAALAGAAGLRQSGRTVSVMRGGATARIVRTVAPPDRLRVEVVYPGEAPEVRVLDGDRAWRGGEPAPVGLRAAMRLQAARLALPFLLLAGTATLTDHGTRSGADGARLRVLELPVGEHMSLLVAVDPDSGRVLRSRGVLSMNGAEAMDFATAYDDFRDWDGIRAAAREDQYAMGRYTGRTVIERVEVLDRVGPEAFRP